MNNSIKSNLHGEINFNNFFMESRGYWKPCKKPKRKEDYVSKTKKFLFTDYPENFSHLKILVQDIASNRVEKYYIQYETDEVSSMYWYGKDHKGFYVIRFSNHWGRVAKCNWQRRTDFNQTAPDAWRACKTYLS